MARDGQGYPSLQHDMMMMICGLEKINFSLKNGTFLYLILSNMKLKVGSVIFGALGILAQPLELIHPIHERKNARERNKKERKGVMGKEKTEEFCYNGN